MLEYVCDTKNGYQVFVDKENSHAATHIKETPQLLDLVREVLGNHEAKEGEYKFQTDLKREIGFAGLVETDKEDKIFLQKD